MSEAKIALLIDMDNIIYASENFGLGRFQINPIIEVLKDKGRLIIKRAYADWNRHYVYRFEIQDLAIDLIELPQRGPVNKNSTDIKMVVDAMEIAMSMSHIDTFAIVTGDKDFFPLITKLREHNLQVIGIGVRESTSGLLVQNCDEFIYYNNLVESRRLTSDLDRENIYQLLVDTIHSLHRDGKERIQASFVKKSMLRKRPDFHEGNFGFNSFSGFLKVAAQKGFVNLDVEPKTGILEVSAPPTADLSPENGDKSEQNNMENYLTILNSVGLRPMPADIQKRIFEDICSLLKKPRDNQSLILNDMIEEIAEVYERDKVRIHKSMVRDMVRMMMYIGSFKDFRNRWLTSYTTPIAHYRCDKTIYWTRCLWLIHILKYDSKLTNLPQACKILFGSPDRRAELARMLKFLKLQKLISETRTDGKREYQVQVDRYFIPWK